MTRSGRLVLSLAAPLALAACHRDALVVAEPGDGGVATLDESWPLPVDHMDAADPHAGRGACAAFTRLQADLYSRAPLAHDRFRASVLVSALEGFSHAFGCEAGDTALALSPE